MRGRWPEARVWGTPVAVGLAAGSAALQIGAGAPDGRVAVLAALRMALGAAWLATILIILAQEAGRLARTLGLLSARPSLRRRGIPAWTRPGHGPPQTARSSATMSGRARLGSCGVDENARYTSPYPHDGGRIVAPATSAAEGPGGGRVPWPRVLRRAILVSTLALPRFLPDPAGHLVVSWWLVILLVCGHAYVEPILGPHRSAAYWIAAALLVLPWGTGAVQVHWPPFS
jgi:hypothetical protein